MKHPETEAAIQRAILRTPEVQQDADAWRYHTRQLARAERQMHYISIGYDPRAAAALVERDNPTAPPSLWAGVTPPPKPQFSRNATCPLCDEPGKLTDMGICQDCQLIADEVTSGLYTYAPEAF